MCNNSIEVQGEHLLRCYIDLMIQNIEFAKFGKIPGRGSSSYSAVERIRLKRFTPFHLSKWDFPCIKLHFTLFHLLLTVRGFGFVIKLVMDSEQLHLMLMRVCKSNFGPRTQSTCTISFKRVTWVKQSAHNRCKWKTFKLPQHILLFSSLSLAG